MNTDTGKGMPALKDYVDAVRRLDLEEESREAILGGTAARLLKFPAEVEISRFDSHQG
ncbi:MAG: hypothetical protein ACREQW_02240 [Candidatus Binatia bacterium]